jgi:hypothetical protein
MPQVKIHSQPKCLCWKFVTYPLLAFTWLILWPFETLGKCTVCWSKEERALGAEDEGIDCC